MTDHLPECPMLAGCHYWSEVATEAVVDDEHRGNANDYCPRCGIKCICSALRACEKRVLDAHIAILESARPSGKCDCDWCAEHDWLIFDLIHALKEKP